MYLNSVTGAALATALSVSAAWSATLTSVEVTQTLGFPPAAVFDTDSDKNTDATSQASLGGFGVRPGETPRPGETAAFAIQNPDGSSSVSTSATTVFSGREYNTAEANLTVTETNTTGDLVGYAFTFSLFDLELQVQETYGYSPYFVYTNPFENADSRAAGNAITYEVVVNGALFYTANATLYGGVRDGFTLDLETFTAVETDLLDGTTLIGRRSKLNNISETLFLGNYADGETVTVETRLFSESISFSYEGEQSAGAQFGDPSGLGGAGRQLVAMTAPVGVSAVPLPATGWMLIACVAGLGAMRRLRG